MHIITTRLFLCIATFFTTASLFAQTETDYIKSLAIHLNAQSEVTVYGGRVDLITDEYAIEVERAHKWKNSIGQALWYSLQTNKKAGIILIVENRDQNKYAVQLNSALAHVGLNNGITVWIYPTDFPGVSIDNTPNFHNTQVQDQTPTNYWLSTNSNKRHKRTCGRFEKSEGRYCTGTEGQAAGCCH